MSIGFSQFLRLIRLILVMGLPAVEIFFWIQLANVGMKYRTALTITGLMTFIAIYWHFRIRNTWNDSFDVKFSVKEGYYVVCPAGVPINVAFWYVNWFLTVS